MIGERIHSYEINAHLGQGGMGNVYRATDTMLGREVALKMLHPQLTVQTQFLERFKKEARVLAQLLHPNIAVIYNFIEQGGNHFMVMEYVEGTSLDELLKKYHSLPAEFVVPVFIQALEGLQHAHRKNIFHRDVKPSNLMITSDGTLKLMDFGIAKVAGEQKMTQVNKIVGTIEFMAPELIEGKDASVASDIYSMGATLYELVSGKLPFESDTDFNLMQAILKKKAIAPDKLNDLVPKKLSDIILKAMDKNPAGRYPDARSFQQALIAAFPAYREININSLNTASQGTYARQHSGLATRPNQHMASGSAMETRVEFMGGNQATWKEKASAIFSNRRNKIIAAALFLFLLVAVVFLTRTGGEKKINDSSVQDDVVKLPEKQIDNGGNTQETSGPVIVNEIPREEIVSPVPVVPEQPAKEDIKPVRTKDEQPVKKKNTETAKPVEKELSEKEKQTPGQDEKKDVYISSSGVEVSLVLRSSPDLNQKQKQAQRVSFTVSRPVVYNGVTIIRSGAVATGSLTIGRVMTDIEISNVEAANGRQIPLKSAKAHGKRADVESNRHYTAYLVPGTRISF
ncbi:MAG: protein kinase [Ferruginibacter sp.]|nr:protein kinase [Ferruginibacter sp.]